MQIKETPDLYFPGLVDSPPLKDVVVLAHGAGVMLGVRRAFCAIVRSVYDDGRGLIVSRCVEIPLVGSDGEISGVLCWAVLRSDTGGVACPNAPEWATIVRDVSQFVLDDINNRLALLGNGPQPLECQSDAASPAATEIIYTPSPSGGVFHIVNSTKAAPTS